MSSEDIVANQAEATATLTAPYPTLILDAFVYAFATRIAKLDKWVIANTERLVNTRRLSGSDPVKPG